MITINVQGLTEALFNRAALDIVASDLRAILGSATLSVIPADRLELGSKPPRPFIALREDVIITLDRIVQVPTYRWFLYDDRENGSSRINKLIPLLYKAYSAELLNVNNILINRIVFDSVSQYTTDTELNLGLRYVSLSVEATW